MKTKEEALAFCYKHRDDYIKSFDSVDEGIRQFDCLVDNIESGITKPEEMADYGMSEE